VHLDGTALDRTWLTGTEVHAGGRLRVELGPAPGPWTGAARPPSLSTAPGTPHSRTPGGTP
jgi:putative alpha-1,2-mannosidase